ncbi:MAG: hypothetical protein UH241_11355 [Acutalibacteraceae bacterium]|nr:hypothetical protein [Acutalibacteraceae bacterium]
MKQFCKTFNKYYLGNFGNLLNEYLKEHPSYEIAIVNCIAHKGGYDEILVVFNVKE